MIRKRIKVHLFVLATCVIAALLALFVTINVKFDDNEKCRYVVVFTQTTTTTRLLPVGIHGGVVWMCYTRNFNPRTLLGA